MPLTTAVSVKFTLYSTTVSPPYEVAGCEGVISYDDGTSQSFNGWNAEDIGTPQPNGASFSLVVADSSYSSGNNQTGIANWALIVQMTMADGVTVKCFSSDPEMEVST